MEVLDFRGYPDNILLYLLFYILFYIIYIIILIIFIYIFEYIYYFIRFFRPTAQPAASIQHYIHPSISQSIPYPPISTSHSLLQVCTHCLEVAGRRCR
ncbi:hypothetical protein SISSUDRAFT_724220 [Sistotremastrum suecicum HHB10207 ss-3]|uniref:Uncharacterized protein n=1 Tax=Sistotremastrum suecicum HHB10207 ss-3 TaxID=1314776 RepID=A0A165WRV5_9AGAM|nr:hypothetical protein SISSUDRAFT_724220 [Sistotremastrum suecicum HHB10207 ss-3]